MTENKQQLDQQKLSVEKQLADLKIPLLYFPYLKANCESLKI